MRKLFSLVLALVVMFGGVSYAELQTDKGTTRGQAGANSQFFVARNGRVTGISADRVVIWDTTSNDGVTVTTTTTSADRLVAGVTIDAIPGVTSDNTAASGLSQNNWGRVKTYGRHANVLTAASEPSSAGQLVITSSTAGAVTGTNSDTIGKVSGDGQMVGVALEAASSTLVDVFVRTQ